MLAEALFFIGGVVVGHFVPALYTKLVSYFSKAETEVVSTVETGTVVVPAVAPATTTTTVTSKAVK